MKFTPVAVAGLIALATGASAREMLGSKSDGEAVKYIDSAAIAAKGEADGAKMAAMLEKKAAKSLARGEADAGKYAKKLVTGESDKADCDKKAAGEAVSFTVTTTVTKEAKEGKSKKSKKGGGADEAGTGAGKFGEVVAAKTAKEVAKATAKGEADAINLANRNAADLAVAQQRLANAGRRLAGCGKDGACPPPKTPEPVVYVVKSKVVKEAAKAPKDRSAKEIAKDEVIVAESKTKIAMYKDQAKGIEAGVNATKKVWDAQLKATQAELKNEVNAFKTTGKYAYESGKAAALTASADARLAATKGRRRLAGAEPGVPTDAEFAARAGLPDAKVKHVKGDTKVAPAPRPAPTAAEKAKLEAYKAGTTVYVAKYAAEEARNKAIAAEMDAKRNATRAMHPKIEAKEKLAAAQHAEDMVAWKAKTGPKFAAKAAEEAANKKLYNFTTGERKP